MALIQSNANDKTPNKPQTNPSAKEPQIPNKMEIVIIAALAWWAYTHFSN